MASRSLTDRARNLRQLLSPGRFLAGRLTPGTLHLSLFSPNGRRAGSQETTLLLSDDSWEEALLTIGLPKEERGRIPFLLFWPDEKTLTASVGLPPTVTAAERVTVAGAEVESLLPWPLEESLLALLPQKRKPSRLLLWAASQEEVAGVIARIEESGLSPRWVLPESLLIEVSVPPPSGRETETTGMIHVEENRAVCQLREFGPDGADIVAVSACRLAFDTTPLDRDRRILDLLLSLATSGVSLPPRFAIDTPVLPESPLFPLVSPVPPVSCPLGEAAYRVLSGLSKEERDSLNFRKGPLLWQGDRAEIQKGLRSLVLLSLVLVGVLVADGSAHLSRMNHRVERAREALDREARLALPGHTIVMPVEQLTQEKAALDRQRHLLSRGADIIGLMKAITSAPPPGVKVELVSLSISRRFVTLSGKTGSFRSVDAFKSSLAATGRIRDISIQSAGLDIDRKTVTFRMRGRHD
ncbi:MAG: hypothetical protein ACP5OP_07310 [Leptospirillia bacterium]